MIRRSGTTTSNSTNVLEGTQFATLAEPLYIRIRAANLMNANAAVEGAPDAASNASYATGLSATVAIGSVTISKSLVNQISKSQANASGKIGLDDGDIIFEGWVPKGNLSLEFTGIASNTTSIWDCSAY